MAKQTYLYEILIRGTPDGKVAAHQIFVDRYTLEGDKVVDMPRGAEPLDPAKVGGVVGAQFADVGSQLATLSIERDAAVAEAKSKTEAIAAAKAALEQALAALG